MEYDLTNINLKLQQQAVLNQEVCDHLLAAFSKVEEIKLLIKELDNALRIQARELSLKTEAAVTEKVESDESLKALRRELKTAIDDHEQWSHLRYSYQQMAKNMENSTKLIVSGFIAY